jgi:hypothetical protein
MAELRSRFDWSTLRIFDLNTPGQNYGILLGTNGWAPRRLSSLNTIAGPFHILNVDHPLQLKIDNKIYAARWPSACCAV